MSQPEQPNSFVKFSGMAVQMAVVIGLSSWGGLKLDEHYQNKNSLFTIILSLAGIIAAMYLVLKDFIKPNK
jgi:F0F1-type ATP synthase assembly protein I